ncbi:MAG: hypothetical protein KZQ93_05280 [Candidatus Thiodiazotropha sp. (ex Monitilora ramsayi)]|nr:hypothetical protein [Candidatus Thiodiazotropha sp. (ex Monitilora ramsayi)]
MDRNDIQELLACLSKERTLYRYCRDYYAVQLLKIAADRHGSIHALKGSRFGRLLNKPAMSPLLSRCGDGQISNNDLSGYWQEPGTTYLVTTGVWGSRSGRYQQTSRPGYNLVLRLNFNHQHDALLRESIHPTRDGVFNYWGHPQLERGDRSYYRETMAWARLDIDLDRDEVLVEEIQSDWVRDIAWLRRRLTRCESEEEAIAYPDFNTTAGMAHRYLQFVEPLLKEWSQAMLAATIDFVRRELGLSQLWYHTWEAGNCLKRISRRDGPPRSLYTALPRQFCFEQTDQLPGLLNDRRTIKRLRRAKVEPNFYKLEL